MKLLSLIGIFIMSTSVSAFGNDSEREIKQIELKIAEAVLHRDVAFIDRVFANDFAYTGVHGEVKGKADIVGELKAGDLTFEVMKFDDIRVRVFGDAAVATGRAITKGRSKQGEITGQVRYTRVYIKRNNVWQLVAFQGTNITAAK